MNDGVINEVKPGVFCVHLAKALYEREAVFAAAYKFREDFFIRIEPVEETHVGIWFEVKRGQAINEMRDGLGEFCNEVLDQQVRMDLDKRFGHLREAIYEQAFRPINGRG